ncbi:TauD/TfdA family dioxygenase [Pelagibacteraceae bacterium]|nr:TauD/TfdA family dioxygenase [Pelagibacteraceae bacterium]|tara:strand:- start:29 stop:841 length:813 start_codon:yes stop_codon:yes gene_type:complete
MKNISINPGKNNVGAYVNDINLKNLNENQVNNIKDTLNQFGVIFIKEQNLDPESYQNFAKSIGQPVIYPRLKGLDEKYPFINVIERKPDDRNLSFGSSWLHQDTSYLADDRPRYTMLMGIEIPVGQGNTIFSSGFNAYEKLPEKIKDKIKDATGIFSSAGPIAVTRLEREKEMGIKSSESMEAEHPIVKTVNGKKTLYVSPGHLIKIKNVDEKDSDYLKDYLIEHVNKEKFIFSYEWSKGDICLWDNLSVLHMASEIKNCKRVMYRITIK